MYSDPPLFPAEATGSERPGFSLEVTQLEAQSWALNPQSLSEELPRHAWQSVRGAQSPQVRGVPHHPCFHHLRVSSKEMHFFCRMFL